MRRSQLRLNTRHEQGPRSSHALEVHVGDVMHESKNVQEPRNDHNDYDSIEDRFNGARHRNEAVDEPEKNPHDDQGNQDLE
jgi:hypothetical protein